MKVLLIDVNCKSGSTGKIVYDLYSNLIEGGHEAAICYGRGRTIDEPNIFKFGLDVETYFHALMTRITGFTGCFSFFSTKRLLKYMNKFKPDVVHINELHGYFVNLKPVIKYLKKNGIKTIWTFHCEFMYTGRCGYAYDCQNWKKGCGKCPKLNEYPRSLFFDFSFKMLEDKKRLMDNFKHLIIATPSDWLAYRTRCSIFREKEVQTIYNGIDVEKTFLPTDYSTLKIKHNLGNEKIILSVAPNIMDERKGGRWILTLAKMLKNENIKFILIGVNDLKYNFDENIIAIGRTENQKELSMYYSMADIFLLTSYRETFSLVCAESLSCGTPIVGFKAGAPEEIVPPEFGTFVEYGDINALRDAIKEKLCKESCSLECREYAVSNFSTTIMYKKYEELYFKLYCDSKEK